MWSVSEAQAWLTASNRHISTRLEATEHDEAGYDYATMSAAVKHDHLHQTCFQPFNISSNTSSTEGLTVSYEY